MFIVAISPIGKEFQFASIANEMENHITAYRNTDLNEFEFMTAMTQSMKRFTAMYDFSKEVWKVFEAVEQYI